MPKIHVLSKATAELIAAGEVVERPASAVKELLENSIDAGAAAVTVEIQNGGVTLIRVSDNGAGIAREDVPAAFLRHATSKVREADDLSAIATLGFRGEALASVAAVARVEMLTRTADEAAGTRYRIAGGGEDACEDAGCPVGTVVTVRDLFYNVPARMKFLKKDVAEANAVAGTVDRIALSHPEVSVKLIRDGREQLFTPGDGQLVSAVAAVYGGAFAAALIPVDYVLGGVTVKGLLSRPAAARPNRAMQNFFLNGRFVRSRTAAVAVEEACKGAVMAGKFPACILHIEMPLEAVDVNVHPAKTEVRFANERPVFDAVYHACKTALAADEPMMEYALPAPPHTKPNPAPPDEGVQTALPSGGEPLVIDRFSPGEPVLPAAPPPAAPLAGSGRMESVVQLEPAHSRLVYIPQGLPPQEEARTAQSIPPPAAAPSGADTPQAQRDEASCRIIGELFKTYILLEMEDELVLMDKHAAHERLIYESLRAEAAPTAQMLLDPVVVALQKEEYTAVLQNFEPLRTAGFEIEDFGAGTVIVRGAPMTLGAADLCGIVAEMAGKLSGSGRDFTPALLDWIYHSVACRAAVKAGDRSDLRELAALARRTLDEDVRSCPHGRPVAFRLPRRELEKRFGRA